MVAVKLKLFVTGGSEHSDFAVNFLRSVLKEHDIDHSLEVVDVLDNHDVNVSVTPLLVKEHPVSFRRLNDFSDKSVILKFLGK